MQFWGFDRQGVQPIHSFLTITSILLVIDRMLIPSVPVQAQTPVQCTVIGNNGQLYNQAEFVYNFNNTPATFGGKSTRSIINIADLNTTAIISAVNITNSQGQPVTGLGQIAHTLEGKLLELGFSSTEIQPIVTAGLQSFVSQSKDTATPVFIAQIKNSMQLVIADPNKKAVINQIPNPELTYILIGLNPSYLQSIGLTDSDMGLTMTALNNIYNAVAPENNFGFLTDKLYETAITNNIPYTDTLNQRKSTIFNEITQIQTGSTPAIKENDLLFFNFELTNNSQNPTFLKIPSAQQIQESGFRGNGTITQVTYTLLSSNNQTPLLEGDSTEVFKSVTLNPDQRLKVTVAVKVGSIKTINLLSVGLASEGCLDTSAFQTASIIPGLTREASNVLIDPLGRVTGCAGEILADYRGFSLGIYDTDPNNPTELKGLTELVLSELPDDPNNNIPQGVVPNIENNNPFYLTNSDQGRYSFLLDESRGQLVKGTSYILLINPPPRSPYEQRRIRILLGDRTGNQLKYTAISLDGRPITGTDNRTSIDGILDISDANKVGLSLAVLDLGTSVCEAQEIDITKSGDRASAQPGDIVIYRITVRALAATPLNQIMITDVLPLGFVFKENSVRGETNKTPLNISTTQEGQKITFTLPIEMQQGQVVTLVYGAEVTPDAVRGTGKNSASVNGRRIDNGREVKDGPEFFQLAIRQGIITDYGTIIGKVFVDKNFDGEQQAGEAGIPNAVVYLQDGNRVTTDADGMFSVKNVPPGYITGTIDFTTLPGYILAPNLYFSERNSQSRLVHLEPGGLVRMNFGVTPAYQEEGQP